jgi:hypothetical protein
MVSMGSLWLAACGGVTEVSSCGAASPCEPFYIDDCGVEDGCPQQTAYLDTQTCALDALRKGEPALLDFSSGCEGICAGDILLLRGDGSVVKQPYYDEPYYDDFDDTPSVCTLSNPMFFEACLSAFDETCLDESKWLSGCQEVASFSCD